jgi:hypothetical protein
MRRAATCISEEERKRWRFGTSSRLCWALITFLQPSLPIAEFRHRFGIRHGRGIRLGAAAWRRPCGGDQGRCAGETVEPTQN